MINQDTKLKLQAYLDNELGDREAREIVALLERDAEAQALSVEIKGMGSLLRGNELDVKLPESRDFYWSKIERAISRAPAPQARPSFLPNWLRLVAPALGLAVFLVAALSVVHLSTGTAQNSYLHEIDTPLEDTGVISFHSQSAGMTVVWVDSRAY